MTEAEPLAKVQVDVPAHRAALPSTLRRKTDVIGREITSTKEKIHGLLRLGAGGGASVRWLWWRWPPGRYLVLTAALPRSQPPPAGRAEARRSEERPPPVRRVTRE